MSAGMDPSESIGRVEEHTGAVTPVLAGMLSAALGHPAAPPVDIGEGSTLPYLWHWVAFPEFVPLADLGRDGHPRLGRFLPDCGLERRMWAGGKLAFEGRFRIGETLRKRSTITAVDEKSGSAGRMVFVKVSHELEGENGGRIDEQQDIVYLAIPPEFRPPKAIPPPEDPDFDEPVTTGETRLFRYSAATFNAHRIHYDMPYTREIEKYPGLVVHGPMQATLLMEAGVRHAARPVAEFRFRGVHPMFHHHGLRLVGKTTQHGEGMDLCTVAPQGHHGLQATIKWGAETR